MTGGRVQAVDVLGSGTMNINMNDVVKQLIENNTDPIISFEKLTDEEVLRRFITNNEFWLLPKFKTGFLLDIYNHLFQLLTVDCLIKIKQLLQPVEIDVNYIEHGKYTTEYCYVLEWDYEREKEISPKLGEKVVNVELKTPQKHNLLIKINNSFPLRGYLPELGEFDYNQQFTAIECLVKDIHTIFVFKMKRTGEMPRIEFLVNRLIKEMNLELTDWGEVKKFVNIIDVSIDGLDFSAKIEKQFFSAALPELGVEK